MPAWPESTGSQRIQRQSRQNSVLASNAHTASAGVIPAVPARSPTSTLTIEDMETVLIVVVVVVVVTVTLLLVKRNGLPTSGETADARSSRMERAALEERYQADLRDGGPGSR